MAPKPKTTASVGTKRKHEEVKEEPEDIISSGSELTEDEYQGGSDGTEDQDEYDEDEPPKKSKKVNGKSSPEKAKPTTKKSPSTKKTMKEDTKPKKAATASESKKSGKNKDIPSDTKPRIKTKNPAALLEYLLSDEALDYANPAPAKGYGEVDWSKHTSPSNPKSAPHPLPKPTPLSTEKDESKEIHPSVAESEEKEEYIRYPHSPMTPFQTLLSSLLLSKPLSHKLGIRTICTLLNPPFNFGKFEILRQADEARCLEALFKARTQHKEKTSIQLLNLIDGVRGLNGENEENSLNGIKRAIENLDDIEMAQKRVGDMLKSIKGIGPVGVGIFLRRIQGQWLEVFPYVDERCLNAARSIGLIKENHTAKEMGQLVEGDSKKLVKLLDVLIGLDLEKGKLDEVLSRYP